MAQATAKAKKSTGKSADTEERVSIPRIEIKTLILTVIGDSPLIMHRWSEKAKRLMLDKQMKKAVGGKEAKDPAEDFAQSAYIVDEKPGDRERMRNGDFSSITFGFPACGFKAAAVGACRYVDGAKMTVARGGFHLVGDLVEIETDGPTMREDMVRIAQGTADIRYRAEFKNWRAKLQVRYNSTAMSVEQIVNLMNTAGFGVGVGEWRPEKDGSFGMFHVATGDEA